MKTSQTLFTLAILAGASLITAFALPFNSQQKAPFADKYWILESGSVTPAIDLDGDGKADTDIRVMLEDCQKDDAEMYKTGGKVMKHDGKLRCDEEEEAVITEKGTWTYDAATKQLTSKDNSSSKPQTVTVKEATATKMVVTYVFTSTKGKHTINAVYKAK